jgi:hypothetical protein
LNSSDIEAKPTKKAAAAVHAHSSGCFLDTTSIGEQRRPLHDHRRQLDVQLFDLFMGSLPLNFPRGSAPAIPVLTLQIPGCFWHGNRADAAMAP